MKDSVTPSTPDTLRQPAPAPDNERITIASKSGNRRALEPLLIELLLGDESRAETARKQLEQSLDKAGETAELWKVLPQFLERTQSCKHPPKTRRAYMAAYGRSSQRIARARPAIDALTKANIAVAAFKGLASIAMLYGDPRRRSIHDVDLLIRPADLTNALKILDRHNFRPQGVADIAEYRHFVANAPGFAGNQAIALYDGEGGEIDLHWELRGSGLNVDDILQRAVEAQQLPVVSPADALTLTAHHAVRENLAVAGACRDLLDIRLWCHRLQETGTIATVAGQCARSPRASSVLAAANILGNYAPAGPAVLLAAALECLLSPAQCRAARELGRLFHYQLQQGALDNDVLFLVHSRPWLLILRGLSLGWPGYRRTMRSLETQLEQDRPLHRRLLTFVRSIPGREGLRLARQLARVKFG
jgi:hypothetical protein